MSNVKKWSKKDENFLLKNKNMGADFLARYFDRTPVSVQSKLQSLKSRDFAKSGTPWSQVDKQFLVSNIDEPNSVLCGILGRGPKDVSAMRYELKKNGEVQVKRIGQKVIEVKRTAKSVVEIKKQPERLVGQMTLHELVNEATEKCPAFGQTVSAIKRLFPHKHTSAARIIAGKVVNAKRVKVSWMFEDGENMRVDTAVIAARMIAADVLVNYINKTY